MDSLGSEVGQKMRSAVKAKLLELGTGGSAGYIDDELPDYVMIMVANKKSKQQMISDLYLFLGSQTDLFVTWLHEVLQKLQEVTLPAVALQKKRKTSQKDEASSSKKDKKEKKKDKKGHKKCETESSEVTSITDVFAGEFLEKAKKTFEIDTNAVQKHKKQEVQNTRGETDDFDIPTISEISNQGPPPSMENREKDLAELAEIQRKIYAAKKQLKILDDVDESEDEDFLNIKEDGEEFDEGGDLFKDKKKNSRTKSPIVFESDKDGEKTQTVPISADGLKPESTSDINLQSTNRQKLTEFDRKQGIRIQEISSKEKAVKKRSIHERLGNLSKDHRSSETSHQHRRAEKEIYIPVFRRREMEKEKRSNGEINIGSIRKNSTSSDVNKKDSSHERISQQRIGSRVVVAPPKPDVNDDDDDNQSQDRPVNSIIKIKPRPSISPSKQACKNLLLRAVAEAQRSTILVKPKKDISISKNVSNSPTKRNTKFFTKSYRDRVNRDALLRRTAKNLVIEVKADMNRNEDEEMEDVHEEEYVPEHISDRGESDMELIYIPQTINSASNEEELRNDKIENDAPENKTQFVVTLNDKNSSNYKTKSKSSRVNGAESSNRNAGHRENLDVRNRLTLKTSQHRNDRESNSSPSCNTPPRPSSSMSSSKKSELIKIYRKPKEVKKIVIKNDSEDEDFHSPKKESPNKSHNSKEEVRKDKLSESKDKQYSTTEEEGSTTPPLPICKRENKASENQPNKRKRQLIKFDLAKQVKVENIIPTKRRSKSEDCDQDYKTESSIADEKQKISIKNVESKKYDNLPSSLSSVPIDSLVIKTKPKERCKYYPSCTKDSCEFYHPAAPCKSFPNCKYADKCLYVHPKCKFDQTCNRIGCNFQHSISTTGQCTAPPLSSHVVPVQNYKSISTSSAPSMCKFYPNCSKPLCPFFHPKMCRFGRNCNNKLECNFYHHDVASNKFKWVASVV